MGLVATVAVALLACDVSRGTKSHHAEQLRLDVRAQTKKNKARRLQLRTKSFPT